MARGRTTPYTAQLKKYLDSLDAERAAPFSAATLEKEFTHPRKPKLATRVAGIHKALARSFAAGELVTFVDENGAVMRESERVAPGSKAVGQPQIFALPGTPSPDPAFRPVKQEDVIRRDDARASSAGTPADGDSTAAGDAVPPSARPLSAQEAEKRLAAYVESPPATAPAWIPAAALRVWVALPPVVAHWRRRLDQASPTERIQLIQAGVARKGDIAPDSYAARGLVALCRRRGPFWAGVVPLAMEHYSNSGPPPGDALAELTADPTRFYLDNDYDPFLLLFLGVLSGLSEDRLRDLAQACDDVADSGAVTAEPDRVAELEAELAGARQTVKQLGKELRAGERGRQRLEEQLEAAKAAQSMEAREGALGKERAHRERLQHELHAAQAQISQLKPAQARVDELEAGVAALERARDESRASADRERGQKLEAQSRINDQQREIDALRERVRVAEARATMPTDDPAALLLALARPVGQAAEKAAERLVRGEVAPDDRCLIVLMNALMGAIRDGQDPRLVEAHASTVASTPIMVER